MLVKLYYRNYSGDRRPQILSSRTACWPHETTTTQATSIKRHFSTHPTIRLSNLICLSVYLCLSVCLSIYLSIYRSIHLYLCLSIHPSVSMSIYLCTRIYKTALTVVIRLQDRRPKNRGSIPEGDKRYFLRRVHIVSGAQEPSIQCASDALSPGVKLTLHLHLEPRLRACRSISALQHISS